MSEVFNSWPISLEMSFRIKYVLRVIHCCSRTRRRYTHAHTHACTRGHPHRDRHTRIDVRFAGAFVDLSRRTNSRDRIYVREISRKSDRSFCRPGSCKSLAYFAQWRASSEFARRNKKWAAAISRVNYPPWANWNCRARLPNILRSWVRSLCRRSCPQDSREIPGDCEIKQP